MAMKIEVEVVSKEMVMPSSPTPNHLRQHQLSFLDQALIPVFIPWIYFYPKPINATTNEERCNIVKKSLSKVLSVFYPLAGRLKGNTVVECNDEGVPFVRATANCRVSDIIRHPNDLNKLIPYELHQVNDLGAVVQVTLFECGGMAIGLGMSHKLGDAVSLFMFLNSWSAVARGDSSNTAAPCFDAAAFFPPVEVFQVSGQQPTRGSMREDKVVLRRVVFDAPTLAALKERYADSEGQNKEYPTRAEALSAFIWNRFMAATGLKANDTIGYELVHTVNLRNRMDPPLSDYHFGNIVLIVGTVPDILAPADDDRVESSCNLTCKIRESIGKIDADLVKRLQKHGDAHFRDMEEHTKRVAAGQLSPLFFTCLCGFPIREADFGWGKPMWAGSARWNFKNVFCFFDTQEGDGGIEVWMTLKQEDMIRLESDSEFVAHLSPKLGRL